MARLELGLFSTCLRHDQFGSEVKSLQHRAPCLIADGSAGDADHALKGIRIVLRRWRYGKDVADMRADEVAPRQAREVATLPGLSLLQRI
jgi:hypothetical protein